MDKNNAVTKLLEKFDIFNKNIPKEERQEKFQKLVAKFNESKRKADDEKKLNS